MFRILGVSEKLKCLAFQKFVLQSDHSSIKGCQALSGEIYWSLESRFPSFSFFGDRLNSIQFVLVAAKCFSQPFNNEFILEDRCLENLKVPMETMNLS